MALIQPTDFNLFLPGVMDDPYPAYRELRERAAVHVNEQTGAHYLARYQDVAALGRDPRKLVRGATITGLFEEHRGTGLHRMIRTNLFALDEPDHGRLKSLISKAFFRPRIGELVPRIEEICGRLLDEAELDPSGGTFDLIRTLGYPMPFQVICELLGIEPEDRQPFLAWTRKVLPLVDPFPTAEDTKAAIDGGGQFDGYLTAVIGERRRLLRAGRAVQPGLITDLVAVAEEDGARLSEEELTATVFTVLVAGFENVTNLISNTMRALCENPGQAAALRREPHLVENLADEALRYYSTTQYNPREAAEEIEVDGVTIPKGAFVVLLRGAANRDDRQFPEPDRFDLRRLNSATHVGFGEGPTFCTGAALTRVEVQIAFRELFRRFGEFRIARLDLGPTKLFWGPRAIEVEYARAT
ncbi:cytochrome P450 [Streptomycetaceae bacterium NBC_01309]